MEITKEELQSLKETILNTREIVSRASMTGFNWTDKSEGDWTDDLFTNNGKLTKALKFIDGKLKGES